MLRIINSFMYAIGITTVVYIIVIMISGQTPLLPDYARKFDSDVKALLVQLILVGAMSAALGGGTIIMEFERLGLLAQSAVYFVISLCVWLLVGNFCWCITKYPQAFVSVIVSYTASYIVCWVIQYRICKKNIADINKKLWSWRRITMENAIVIDGLKRNTARELR